MPPFVNQRKLQKVRDALAAGATDADAARHAGLSERTVRNWRTSGLLESVGQSQSASGDVALTGRVNPPRNDAAATFRQNAGASTPMPHSPQSPGASPLAQRTREAREAAEFVRAELELRQAHEALRQHDLEVAGRGDSRPMTREEAHLLQLQSYVVNSLEWFRSCASKAGLDAGEILELEPEVTIRLRTAAGQVDPRQIIFPLVDWRLRTKRLAQAREELDQSLREWNTIYAGVAEVGPEETARLWERIRSDVANSSTDVPIEEIVSRSRAPVCNAAHEKAPHKDLIAALRRAKSRQEQ